jgi:hypothetical protein
MSSKKAAFTMVFVLFLASLSCTNPIVRYFSTRTAVMETATATMWTPTPTNTPTSTPTQTPTKTPTNTLTPTPDNRFYEKGGAIEYSYIPPTGWRKSMGADGLYEWQGKGDTILTFNIQEDSMDAAAAGALMENTLKSALTGFVLVDEGVFSPDSGLDSYRFSFTADFQGVTVYGELYAFSGSDYLVEGLYLRSDVSNQNQDPLVKESLLTMRFE